MASITANGSKGHHKFTLNVSESSYSVANNTSSVAYSFVLSPVQTSWNWELWGDKISYSITINGTNYSGTIPAYDGYATVTLKSGSLTVAHNSDGGKSISYSFSVTDSTGQSYTSGNASASGTLALTTIPRATTPTLSASSVTMGSAVTITMTPASNTFKHKIRYAFGSVTNSVVGLSIGENFTATGTTTATLTPPVSLGNQIPNAMSDKCTITCYTYTSSGSHIGTTTVNLTLNVPSYTPFIDGISLAGGNLLSSTYVQNKSTVSVDIVAYSSYGATISTYSSVVDGKTYTGRTFTTSALSSGTKTVKTTVTDSRGRTATLESSSFVVYAYSVPYITKFTLARESNGTTVTARLEGGVSSVNGKNAKTFAVTLNGVTKTITSTADTVNGTATFTDVSTDKTFEAVAKITDSYTSVSKNAVLPTVAVTMDFYKDGNGIAMGKVAEQGDLLDVAWRIKNASVPTLIGGLGTSIPSNANLNSTNFINPGNYVCPSNAIAQTLSNTPTKFAFKMCVHNVTNAYADASNQWTYLVREITNYQGERWVQDVNQDTGSWVFSAWRLMITSSNVGGYIGEYIKPYTADYVVENGSTGIWDYRKWNSGYAECWGNFSVTPSAGNATNSHTVTLPFSFINTSTDTYKVQITPAKTGLYIAAIGDCNSSNNLSHTTTNFIFSYKYNNATPYNVSFNISVGGKWK